MSKLKMLYIIGIIPLFLFCKGKNNNTEASSSATETSISDNDSINIDIENFQISFSREELDFLTETFPQLKGINGVVEDPDSALYRYPMSVDGYSFDSEGGKNLFFGLYTYFLREKTGDKYNAEREHLIKLYNCMNDTYGSANRKTTYFENIGARIIGYVEYNIYCYKPESDEYSIADFAQQKKAFLENVQRVTDHGLSRHKRMGINIDNTDIKKGIQQIDSMITDGFYLTKAKEFNTRFYNF